MTRIHFAIAIHATPTKLGWIQRGVTLLELMVVVLIVAVLASVTVAGYRQQALRAHRSLAQSALSHLAAEQERFYLQHNRYADSPELELAPPSGLGLAATAGDGRYRIEIEAADAMGYRAAATATESQAADAHCAKFGLNESGARTATNDDCWR